MHTKFDIYIFITGAGIFVTTVVAGTIAIICPFNAMERPFLRDVHRSHHICPPISQIVLRNFIKIECPEEILIKLAIVLMISKSS
jgi:capsule polysaccharide export protein KpsC/LpsZ